MRVCGISPKSRTPNHPFPNRRSGSDRAHRGRRIPWTDRHGDRARRGVLPLLRERVRRPATADAFRSIGPRVRAPEGSGIAGRLASPLTWRSRAPPARRNFLARNARKKKKPRSGERDDAPGLAVRRVAADIVEGVLNRHRALDEMLEGSDARSATAALVAMADRDRGLTRAIVAVVLRRLGTLRHLIGSFLEEGLPAQAPRVETALLIRRSANSVSRSARPCRGRSGGAAGARGFQRVAFYRLDQRGAAAGRARRRRAGRGAGCAGARYAAMADGALDQDLRRGDRARHCRRQWPRAGARSDGEKRCRRLGGKTRRPGAADRFGAHHRAWRRHRAAGL